MASPPPPKKATKDLDFYEALKEIMTGKSVTKREWANRDIYGILRYGRLMIHKADGKDYDWILGDGDMAGDDYVVL